jgi:tetratricopeptide (TPR) repeat protein
MPPHPGMVLAGSVPPLADPYFQRTETGIDLMSGLAPGDIIVLTHGQESAAAPAAQGGTGKSQLAAEFAWAVWNAQTAEILVWVTGTSRDTIVTGFAQAASTVGASGSNPDAEAAAARFVAWLAHTTQRWTLVIDDLADMTDLENLWPAGPAGQVIITTRMTAAVFGSGLKVIQVGGFSRREALSYLSSRLTDYPGQRVEALDLGEDLDGLPLGLAQAAAVMNIKGLSCREYRALFSERRKYTSGVQVAGVSAEILATWSLAAECAHELAPAGLAWPALALAAVLDPHGIPGAVLTSPAACGYITGRPATAEATYQGAARAAITNLMRSGLVSVDPASPDRTVRMHPSVQAAVRAYLPPADYDHVLLAAADALAQTWPETGAAAPGGARLDQALRDCADHLGAVETGALWQPQAHPVLFRRGMSLEDSGLAGAAIEYWQSLAATATRLLGPAHPSAAAARERLAGAYESAGRPGDAIAVLQKSVAERERTQGSEHPDTIMARGQLAHAYAGAGRHAEAILLYEQMAADSSRHLGLSHSVTLAARASLADAYQTAGRGKESLTAYAALTADSERLLGPAHAATLAALESLAGACLAGGRAPEAIDHYRRVLAVREAKHGPDHADVIATRAALASALRRSGKRKDAIAQYERVLADRERTGGADHPDTIAARANLAFAYRSAGQLREAIPGYERTLADRERVQGPDHADTRTARANLASAYQQAGRLADAIGQYERALADSERMLGQGDLETLTARASLAAALYADGRLMEVITILQRTLADSEQYLGPDHPMTRTVRENLDAATGS